jgi:hypothetical protein
LYVLLLSQYELIDWHCSCIQGSRHSRSEAYPRSFGLCLPQSPERNQLAWMVGHPRCTKQSTADSDSGRTCMLFCSITTYYSRGMKSKEDTSLSLGQVAFVLVLMQFHAKLISLFILISCKSCPRMEHQSGDTTASRSTGADPAVTCTCAPWFRQNYPDNCAALSRSFNQRDSCIRSQSRRLEVFMRGHTPFARRKRSQRRFHYTRLIDCRTPAAR